PEVAALSSLVSTSSAESSRASVTRATAFSMPFLRAIGLAPAATLRRPSLTRAGARTVAVVVPSPATSSVFLATSLTSSAPIFSYGSSSSISLAMDTPSLVIVGAPHFFSSTTLRPRGPSVTLTASASWLRPRSRPRRASSSKAIIFAMCFVPPGRKRVGVSTQACRVLTPFWHSTPASANGWRLQPRVDAIETDNDGESALAHLVVRTVLGHLIDAERFRKTPGGPLVLVVDVQHR